MPFKSQNARSDTGNKRRGPEGLRPVAESAEWLFAHLRKHSAQATEVSVLPDACSNDAEGPVCTHDPYPRITPGEYEAFCYDSLQYQDPRFRHAWKCRLDFRVTTRLGNVKVCGFLHLGTAEKPYVGRSSEYHRAWVLANRGLPRKRQTMRHTVFRGKSFRVVLGDTKKRYDGTEHPEWMIYSTVKKILERIGP